MVFSFCGSCHSGDRDGPLLRWFGRCSAFGEVLNLAVVVSSGVVLVLLLLNFWSLDLILSSICFSSSF
uniref:Uncharacterized protein n=1 Tax=Setaria viridis TaxID=4556 RepID=A0A4U6UH17_SETVI|nr:hypothetical protein SEVIR_5G153900v2 [Setaria viridis]